MFGDPASSFEALSLVDTREAHLGISSVKATSAGQHEEEAGSLPPSFATFYGGDLYITEARSHALHQLSLAGDLRRVIAADVLEFPMGVAIDSLDQTIFVADGLTGYLYAISLENGEVLHSTGGLNYPHGVALAADTVFVCDWGRHCVAAFDLELNFKFSIGGGRESQDASGELGDMDPSLCYPRGVATSHDELFVADTDNHRIQVYSHTGRHLRTIYGRGEAQLMSPYALAVTQGRLFVASMLGNLEVLTSQHGSLLHTTDLPGNGVLCGICADARRLFVAGFEAEQSRLYLIAARPTSSRVAENQQESNGAQGRSPAHGRKESRSDSATGSRDSTPKLELRESDDLRLEFDDSTSRDSQPRFGRRAQKP
eukprot:scaffold132180_cov31-Tisochrysis_lutea.AAC.1